MSDITYDKHVVKIQRLFRKNKFKKNCMHLKNLKLDEKTKIYDIDEFKKYIEKKNIKLILKNFITSFSSFRNKKIMTTDEFCFVYLIYGYHSIIFTDGNKKEINNIIKLSNNIIDNINQINNNTNQKLYNNLFNFKIALNFYTSNNILSEYESHAIPHICKIDNIINKFYDNIKVYKIINPDFTDCLNKLVYEQAQYIQNIYKLGGQRGILYMIDNLKKKININDLDDKIKNKLKLFSPTEFFNLEHMK